MSGVDAGEAGRAAAHRCVLAGGGTLADVGTTLQVSNAKEIGSFQLKRKSSHSRRKRQTRSPMKRTLKSSQKSSILEALCSVDAFISGAGSFVKWKSHVDMLHISLWFSKSST